MFLTTKGKFLLSVTTCQFVDPPNLLNAAAVEERPLRETAERATGPSRSRPAEPQSGRPTTHFSRPQSLPGQVSTLLWRESAIPQWSRELERKGINNSLRKLPPRKISLTHWPARNTKQISVFSIWLYT